MEFNKPRKSPRDPKFLGMPDNTAAHRSRLSARLQDIFMSDNPTLSYADLQHQIKRTADSYLPKSSGIQQSSAVEGKVEEDELVRHMSNLPSYLERGKSFQEKPLNIGVLDWRHLEKWKYNNDFVPHRCSDYSSTPRTSYFPTEGSASHSSRGQSSSPVRQRMHSSSLHPHWEASPVKAHSQNKCYSVKGHSYSPAGQRTYHLVPHSHHQKVFKSQSLNGGHTRPKTDKFEEISPSTPNHRTIQKKVCRMDKTSIRDLSGDGLETCDKKEFVSETTSEVVKCQTWDNANPASSSKGKLRIRESELICNQDYHPHCSKEHNRVVLLVPRDSPMKRGLTHLSDSAVSANLMPRECVGRKSTSNIDKCKEPHGLDLTSCVPFCPQKLQDDSNRRLERKSPARSRNTEERESIVVLKTPIKTHLSRECDKRTDSESTTIARHPSPIRRLSSAVGSIIRRAGSRDNSPARRSCSKDPVTKLDLNRAAISASSEVDKSPANCRARSSPLRRLLDPLIKPKAPDAQSDGQLDLLEVQPLKVKSTNTSDRKMDLKDSHQHVRKGSSSVRALLQVAIKNGLPLFTLAVEDDNNILAATLRRLSSAEKNRSDWIYTFFTVHEMKKKNALWLNQGSKGKGHYVPNVIAQMKFSDCRDPVHTRQNHTVSDKLREFTLFSVDIGQVDQNATDFQPTDELAAIIVKLPQSTTNPNSSNTLQDCSRNHIPVSTTLILPGGVHTVPTKAYVSTLTQRWRSGGACDCGGWDLGCQLRIFTNQGDSQKSQTSSNTSEDFKLFSQVGQESQLVLSLNPFKDRIYSVEFDSSISLLQAFATCVAALDCKRPSGFFSANNLFEGRTCRARSSVSGDPARTKPYNQGHSEAPVTASYVSYPLHSPVERV